LPLTANAIIDSVSPFGFTREERIQRGTTIYTEQFQSPPLSIKIKVKVKVEIALSSSIRIQTQPSKGSFQTSETFSLKRIEATSPSP
jgi:hypothetical protein